MSDVVLEVRNLSKLYRLGEIGTGTLIQDLNHWWARLRGKEDPNAIIGQVNRRDQQAKAESVWALRDVSFDVREGEILGLVGSNGAGKSTLLKLISRITSPTTGRIRAKGRIASLLEVGTGMHPEMTARENIFVNGAILGMRRQEITRKFDEIVDFAGCQMYIDTPVKRFSSGMRVRLGFAVAACLEAEILIVDEVLAVGDAAFQRKCLDRMQELSSRSGRTILFVSHNPAAMAALCHRGVLLEHGGLTCDGGIQEVLHRYKNDLDHRITWSGPSGDADLQLIETWIKPKDADGAWDTGKALEVGAVLEILKPVDGLLFGFRLLSDYGAELALSLFDDNESGVAPKLQPGRMTQTWEIPPNTLASGRYRIGFELGLPHRRLTQQQPMGELVFELENLTGLGRRYSLQGMRGFDSMVRPAWIADRQMDVPRLPSQEALAE